MKEAASYVRCRYSVNARIPLESWEWPCQPDARGFEKDEFWRDTIPYVSIPVPAGARSSSLTIFAG